MVGRSSFLTRECFLSSEAKTVYKLHAEWNARRAAVENRLREADAEKGGRGVAFESAEPEAWRAAYRDHSDRCVAKFAETLALLTQVIMYQDDLTFVRAIESALGQVVWPEFKLIERIDPNAAFDLLASHWAHGQELQEWSRSQATELANS